MKSRRTGCHQVRPAIFFLQIFYHHDYDYYNNHFHSHHHCLEYLSLSKKNIELISKQSIPEDENDNGLKENVCRGEKELENDEGVELRTRRHYQEVGQEAGGGWRFIFLSLVMFEGAKL